MIITHLRQTYQVKTKRDITRLAAWWTQIRCACGCPTCAKLRARVAALVLVGLLMVVALPASAQVAVIDPVSGKPLDPAVVAAVAQAMEAARKADPHNDANHTAQFSLWAACLFDTYVSAFAAGKGVQINDTPGLTRYVSTPQQYGLVTMGACLGSAGMLWKQHEDHPDRSRWIARVLSALATIQAMRGQQLLGTTTP